MKVDKHQLGISMVEILIALVISLFLLGGIIQVYVGNKATYGFTNAISRIQENGRFAMDIMSQDLNSGAMYIRMNMSIYVRLMVMKAVLSVENPFELSNQSNWDIYLN